MLDKILEKIGIKSYEDLNEEEKKTYREWEKILSKGEITIEELKKFIINQITVLELQILNPDNSKEKDVFLKSQLRILRVLLGFIESPKKSREWLEGYLKSIFKA